MSAGPSRQRTTDDAIRAMLELRAERIRPTSLDLATIVAAAGPRAPRPLFGHISLAPRLALAGGAVAAVIVAAVFVVSPLVGRTGGTESSRPGESATAAPSAPATSAGPTVAPPEPARVWTPTEAGDLIRTRSAELDGALLAVRGSLVTQPISNCLGRQVCGVTVLADSGGGFVVRPVGDIGPGPWNGSGALDGTLIMRLNAAIENGHRIVDFVGRLTVPPTGGPAWYVQDLLEGAAHVDGAYAAVDGWLVRGPFHPCASDPRNPAVAYDCPTDESLSESDFQPLQPDGSTIGPPAAIDLSSGTYDRWAPDPAPAGLGSRGVEPRHATYLLWLVSDGCGPNANCALPPPRWRIVGRLDPIPPAPAASPGPSSSPGDPLTTWTIGEVTTAQSQAPFIFADARLLEVRGWLVATPSLPCRSQPVPSGAPSWGCDEVDWLTDDPFQPWSVDGSVGSARAPDVGLRVQNGAYRTFARPQSTDPSGAWVPAIGTYLVRGSVHDGCDTLPMSSDPAAAPCAGPAVVLWEVVGRGEPRIPGRLPEMTLPPGVTPASVGDTPCVPAPGPCG